LENTVEEGEEAVEEGEEEEEVMDVLPAVGGSESSNV
jgi:hypothetical protein